ncbi:hypothetical protein Bca52824_096723 [Brassica carinata]|uniref:Uncharacterized protein n=1 Tax=Brassica carinata TaxID=52824 RepID=A0A8X7NZG0_BRACI|nr:hypothetical protein Bca52824_096723 [Brassica carinata]
MGGGGGEALYSSSSSSVAATSSVPPQLVVGDNSSNYGVCYGSNSAAGEMYSQMSVMPLRSDGSLCLMEALNRSSHSDQHHHSQVSSPKMEDFFGTHHNNTSNKEAMDLSLDSLFYNTTHEPNNNTNFQEFFSFPQARNHHEEETRSYQNDPGLTHGEAASLALTTTKTKTTKATTKLKTAIRSPKLWWRQVLDLRQQQWQLLLRRREDKMK